MDDSSFDAFMETISPALQEAWAIEAVETLPLEDQLKAAKSEDTIRIALRLSVSMTCNILRSYHLWQQTSGHA